MGDESQKEIKSLLLKQLRLMMDCFFNTGADFELIINGEFARDDMTKIPARICKEYGMRLLVASVNHENQFDIDGECIGTLGECFSRRGVHTRFGVGMNSADADYSLRISDSGKFHSVSLRIPPHVTTVELTEIRDEVKDIVLIQQLKQPYYGNH